MDDLLHQGEGHQKLWEAGYLAKEIAHRLLAKGQIVPTLES